MSGLKRKYKVVLVGDADSRKTSLVSALASRYPPTSTEDPGIDQTLCETELQGGLSLLLVDVPIGGCGSSYGDNFERFRPLFYIDTDLVIICLQLQSSQPEEVDMDNVLDKWIVEVSHFAPGVPIIIVGTNQDVLSPPNSPLVNIEKYSNTGVWTFLEVAIDTGDGIDVVIETIARAVGCKKCRRYKSHRRKICKDCTKVFLYAKEKTPSTCSLL